MGAFKWSLENRIYLRKPKLCNPQKISAYPQIKIWIRGRIMGEG